MVALGPPGVCVGTIAVEVALGTTTVLLGTTVLVGGTRVLVGTSVAVGPTGVCVGDRIAVCVEVGTIAVLVLVALAGMVVLVALGTITVLVLVGRAVCVGTMAVAVAVAVALGPTAVMVAEGRTAVFVRVAVLVAIAVLVLVPPTVAVTVAVAPPPETNLRPVRRNVWSGSPPEPATHTPRRFQSRHAGLILAGLLTTARLPAGGGRRSSHSQRPAPVILPTTDTQKVPDGRDAGGLRGMLKTPSLMPPSGMMLV